MSPADLFTTNTPMGTARLWVTWVGMGVFIALIFSVLRDSVRRRKKPGTITIGLTAVVIVALLLVFLLPRS